MITEGRVRENKIEKENNSDNSLVSFGPFSPIGRARNFASPENFGAMCYPAQAGVFNIQRYIRGRNERAIGDGDTIAKIREKLREIRERSIK